MVQATPDESVSQHGADHTNWCPLCRVQLEFVDAEQNGGELRLGLKVAETSPTCSSQKR